MSVRKEIEEPQRCKGEGEKFGGQKINNYFLSSLAANSISFNLRENNT